MSEHTEILEKNLGVVRSFLKEDDWHCEEIGKSEVVFFRGVISGLPDLFKNYDFVLAVAENEVQCWATFPASVKGAETSIAEFAVRLNHDLKFGGLDLNVDSGELRFRLCVPAVAVREDTVDVMRFLLLAPVRTLSRCAASLMAVVTGAKTASEAYAESMSEQKEREVKK